MLVGCALRAGVHYEAVHAILKYKSSLYYV
jgi:hypothetical protein